MSTQGITGKEPDARVVYADIIDHLHWQSPTRPHMSPLDRAAQFSPYDALSGYSDMVGEEARLTDRKVDLSETERDKLDRKLAIISESVAHKEKPMVSVVYFVPDKLKDGGHYETQTGTIKAIDRVFGEIVFFEANGILNGARIPIDSVIDITSTLLPKEYND